MNLKYKLILIVLTVLLTNNTFSQTDNTDFSAWFITELNYKLNKKWAFSLQEQLRLKEDASVIDNYFTQLEATYSVTKKLSVSVAYRYIKEHDNQGNIQGYDAFNRLQFDLSYGHKIERVSLKYRLRYQTKNEFGVENTPNKRIRFKTAIEYNIRGWKLDPKLSAEIFNRFGDDDITRNGFNKYRLTLGTSYSTKKIGKFGVFYRFEKDLNTTVIQTVNIAGFKYSYTIKNKKKKKKKKNKKQK